MDNKTCNDFIAKLYGKVPANDLNVIKTELLLFFNDYDIVKKETLPVPSNGNIFKELNHFINAKSLSGCSESTVRQYYRTNSKLLMYCGKSVNEITTVDIQAFLFDYKRNNGVSNVTLSNELAYIKAFFSWLNNSDYITKDPCKAIDKIKVEEVIKKPLTDIQVEQLRNVCKTPREKSACRSITFNSL